MTNSVPLHWLFCNFLISTLIVTRWPPGLGSSSHPSSHNHIKNRKAESGRWEETLLSFLLSQNSPVDFPLYDRPELGSQGKLRMLVLGFFFFPPLLCGTALPARKTGELVWPWEDSQKCLPVAMVTACALPISYLQWANMWSARCYLHKGGGRGESGNMRLV